MGKLSVYCLHKLEQNLHKRPHLDSKGALWYFSAICVPFLISRRDKKQKDFKVNVVYSHQFDDIGVS